MTQETVHAVHQKHRHIGCIRVITTHVCFLRRIKHLFGGIEIDSFDNTATVASSRSVRFFGVLHQPCLTKPPFSEFFDDSVPGRVLFLPSLMFQLCRHSCGRCRWCRSGTYYCCCLCLRSAICTGAYTSLSTKNIATVSVLTFSKKNLSLCLPRRGCLLPGSSCCF